MTPPSVRLFASREAITGDSRGIRRRQRRRFYTSPRSPSRRYGCCSEATLTRQPRRALLIRLSQIGTGRISASQLTTRPTRHTSKNPVNSRRTMVLKGDATKPEQLFAGVVVKSEIFPSLTKRVAPFFQGHTSVM